MRTLADTHRVDHKGDPEWPNESLGQLAEFHLNRGLQILEDPFCLTVRLWMEAGREADSSPNQNPEVLWALLSDTSGKAVGAWVAVRSTDHLVRIKDGDELKTAF
ncbi:hypothetical protein DPEC_G00184530 [Dallia pectoralis]|uniref:Uncharacterized protein n=1 Tax=Dallia pectoralis TaxID=75939 RepID=A0ACC2GB59_DALPE|nr:hypothetical protein DPEC_G00184530 [Dallia pectoralis]